MPASLEALPVELKLGIFSLLPHPRSVMSAAFACRRLFAAFKANQDIIIRAVLINCVGYDVLPEATIVLRCKPEFLSSFVNSALEVEYSEARSLAEYTANFLNQLERPVTTRITWTMDEAIKIGDFHQRTISELVDGFIQFCSTTTYVALGESLSSQPPTGSEKDRMARAFYRFELYRKLFGCFRSRKENLSKYASPFLFKFAPWENAQLACIHDYLGRQITLTFNAGIDSNPIFRNNPPYFAHASNPKVQHLLTLGLDWIRSMILPTNCNDLYHTLRDDDLPAGENDCFLLELFRSVSNTRNERRLQLAQCPPFSNDQDFGPQRLWHLSLSEVVPAIYEPMDWQYRQWGYMFWDYKRLEALGALTLPWKSAQGREPDLYKVSWGWPGFF